MTVYSGRASFFVGRWVAELYWPVIQISRWRFAVHANTAISCHFKNDWEYRLAFFVKLLGFGVGFALDHFTTRPYETTTSPRG